MINLKILIIIYFLYIIFIYKIKNELFIKKQKNIKENKQNDGFIIYIIFENKNIII